MRLIWGQVRKFSIGECLSLKGRNHLKILNCWWFTRPRDNKVFYSRIKCMKIVSPQGLMQLFKILFIKFQSKSLFRCEFNQYLKPKPFTNSLPEKNTWEDWKEYFENLERDKVPKLKAI